MIKRNLDRSSTDLVLLFAERSMAMAFHWLHFEFSFQYPFLDSGGHCERKARRATEGGMVALLLGAFYRLFRIGIGPCGCCERFPLLLGSDGAVSASLFLRQSAASEKMIILKYGPCSIVEQAELECET